ncbi:MAG: tetratricopeptide repeat protein [Deltaproteobacteria bacterium]|nr:tetratricopeptide repeat protein [Deltaproteobacteria bacterium]
MSDAGPSTEARADEHLKQVVADIFEALLMDFPTDALLVELTLELSYLYHPAKAADLLTHTLGYNPENPILCRMMAEMSFDNGDYEKALAYFRKASEHSPQTWELRNRIAESLIALGRYQEVVDSLEGEVGDSTRPGRSHYLLGQAFAQLENDTRAVECFEAALEANPQNAQLAYALGNAYIRLDRLEEAKPHLEAFRKQQAGRTKSALAAASERREPEVHHSASANPWRRGEIANLLGTLCARGNELYRAEQRPERAERILEQGRAAFRQAIDLAPGQPDSHREFARLYLLTDQSPSAAIEFAERAAELESSASNHLILAHAYRANAEDDRAIAALRKAIELEPEWFAPQSDLAWILATHTDAATRRPAEAIRLARRASVLAKHRNPYVRNALAAAHASAGQFARAAKVAESALEMARATRDEALAADILEQLEFYRKGKPYVSFDRAIWGTTASGFRSAARQR